MVKGTSFSLVNDEMKFRRFQKQLSPPLGGNSLQMDFASK